MKPKDIYSLFGNALDNAIECLLKCEESKRNLILKITKIKTYTRIYIENYSPNKITFINGLPQTSKEDKQYHDFGSKSIKYIVEDIYQGQLSLKQENERYILTALIEDKYLI